MRLETTNLRAETTDDGVFTFSVTLQGVDAVQVISDDFYNWQRRGVRSDLSSDIDLGDIQLIPRFHDAGGLQQDGLTFIKVMTSNDGTGIDTQLQNWPLPNGTAIPVTMSPFPGPAEDEAAMRMFAEEAISERNSGAGMTLYELVDEPPALKPVGAA